MILSDYLAIILQYINATDATVLQSRYNSTIYRSLYCQDNLTILVINVADATGATVLQ